MHDPYPPTTTPSNATPPPPTGHPDCAGDIRTDDDVAGCAVCLAATHTPCPGCDTWHPHGCGCVGCVRCDRCHVVLPQEDTTRTVRGSLICGDCLATGYWQCDACDGWNRNDMSCGNDCDDNNGDDDQWCSCWSGCHIDDLVEDYTYKPPPLFHGDGPLFLGMELEVETDSGQRRECAELATDCLGDLGYLKRDESLQHGFEVVTHPMSYPWALTGFPWQMLTDLHKVGCRTSTRTGLHVHVSRSGFGTPQPTVEHTRADRCLHIYRWMKFIHRNAAAVTTLAGRSSPEWAAFTSEERRAVKHYAKGRLGWNRHQAINTGNNDTLELRVFASSLDPDVVRAALAFTAASVDYTRTLSTQQVLHGAWRWAAFIAWLAQHPAYTPLTRRLEDLSCAC